MRLRERFGGHASLWLYRAEWPIESSPENAAIPFPLEELAAWGSWTGEPEGDAKRPRFQSGPLWAARGT